MIRNKRQTKILEIISAKDISTQKSMVDELKKQKFKITQATVSRDIKELGLIKTLSDDGKVYKYSCPENVSNNKKYNNVDAVIRDAILEKLLMVNTVIIKTKKSMGGVVCDFIEDLNLKYHIGCTSGKSIVNIICKNEQYAKLIYEELDNVFK